MTITWRTREELVHRVLVLAKQGTSTRAISRALGIGRNTVRRVLAAHAGGREVEHVAIPPPPSRVPRTSKLDPWPRRIAELSRGDCSTSRQLSGTTAPLVGPDQPPHAAEIGGLAAGEVTHVAPVSKASSGPPPTARDSSTAAI